MDHINDILAKHFSGFTLSRDEQVILEEWMRNNEKEYAALRDTLSPANNYQYNSFSAENAWEKLDQRIEGDKTKVFSLKPILKYAVAASIAVLIGITGFKFFNQPDFIAYHNDTPSVKTLDLPDGSTVYLAKHSSLEYHKDFETNRDINLNGQAFFDVARDENHPFTIGTDYGDVQVLGTSFDVNTNPQGTTVSVKSGRVALKNKNNSIELTANESAHSDGQSISEKSHANPNYLSWKTGHFIFENAPLDQIIKDVQTYYSQTIINQVKDTDCAFTGEFNNQKLEDIIEALALSCNLEFSKENNKFILK